MISASALGISLLFFSGWVEHDKSGTMLTVEGGRLRVDIKEGYYIFDSRTGRSTIVDKKAKVWAQGSVMQVCDAVLEVRESTRPGRGAEGSSARSATEDEIVPFGNDVQIPNAGEGNLDFDESDITVERGGPGPKIAGFATELFRLSAQGRVHSEVWIARHPALAREMRRFATTPVEKLEACGGGPLTLLDGARPGGVESSHKYLALLTTGWVMRKKLHLKDSEEVVADVDSLVPTNAANDLFEPPGRGYRRVGIAKMIRILDD